MTHFRLTAQNSTKLAFITALLAFVVIMLGAFTRLTDAGLSCPDWPHCYGFITAPHTVSQLADAAQKYPLLPVDISKAWTEMTHRYFAGTEGLLILVLIVGMLKTRRPTNRKTYFITAALGGLLFMQIALGMLTVTEKLRPVIVLSHLLTGLSILSVLWWAQLDLRFRDRSFPRRHLPKQRLVWFWLALAVIAAQITLGGWVSTHYAGLACVDFPYCNGQVLPTLHWQQFNTDLITIHMLHRIGAAVTAIYLSLFALALLRTPALRFLASCILALLALQVTLGILNILWLRPVWLALIHHGVAVVLLLTIITTLVKANYLAKDKFHVI